MDLKKSGYNLKILKNGQKSYFYWDFLIFEDSNRLLSLKNPHLDTSDTKIGLKTPKLLISNPWKRILVIAYRNLTYSLRNRLQYARTKILFQGLDISNFGVFRLIFVCEVSRWGFLRLRSRLESLKIRKAYWNYDFWPFLKIFRLYPPFLRSVI